MGVVCINICRAYQVTNENTSSRCGHENATLSSQNPLRGSRRRSSWSSSVCRCLCFKYVCEFARRRPAWNQRPACARHNQVRIEGRKSMHPSTTSLPRPAYPHAHPSNITKWQQVLRGGVTTQARKQTNDPSLRCIVDERERKPPAKSPRDQPHPCCPVTCLPRTTIARAPPPPAGA